LVGANTIINLSEIVTAFCIFTKTKPRLEMFTMGAVAAIGGLIVGDVVFLVVILVSGIQGTELRGVVPDRLPDPGPHINLIVAVGEAVVAGFVVEYLSKVRPDLLVQ
jgi:ABC-type Co2+ transport system permease subunit